MSRPSNTSIGRAALAAALLPCLLIAAPVLLRIVMDFSDPRARSGFFAAFAQARTWRVFAFSLFQAFLSAAFAVVLSFPAALLFAYRDFPGKRLLGALFSLPFVVPTLLLILGMAGFLGNNGAANFILARLGFPRVNFIYGMQGVILAHSFFNFPIAARLINASLAQSDPSLLEAATLLGAGKIRSFLTMVLPEAAPGILSSFFLIFLYCFQSFTVILLLGGGPGYSTLEVEIYQAMRLTFQPGSAACFALLELLPSLGLAYLYARFHRSQERRPRRRQARMATRPGLGEAVPCALYLLVVFLILGGPLLSIPVQALVPEARSAILGPGPFSRFARLASMDGTGILSAAAVTASIGLCAAAIACAFGAISAEAACRSNRPAAILSCAIIPMAISPLILARSLASLAPFLPPAVCLIIFHAALAMPIAAQTAYAGFIKVPSSVEDAARCLGSSPLKTLVTIKLPMARRSILSAFFFSFCVSAGDISGYLSLRITGLESLALKIYRLAGAYRFGDACAIGAFFLILAAVAFAFREEKWLPD